MAEQKSKKTKKTKKTVVQSAQMQQVQIVDRRGVMQRQGRLYCQEIHDKVIENIKAGKSITDSGLLAGLGKETLDTWLYMGRHEPEKFPEYAQLSEDIDRAKAERRGTIVERIVQTAESGAPGTWQAGAWFLERTDPEHWGRKDKVEHVGDTPRQQINTVVLVDADAREAARDLLQRVAGNARPDLAIGPGSGVQLEDDGS